MRMMGEVCDVSHLFKHYIDKEAARLYPHSLFSVCIAYVRSIDLLLGLRLIKDKHLNVINFAQSGIVEFLLISLLPHLKRTMD